MLVVSEPLWARVCVWGGSGEKSCSWGSSISKVLNIEFSRAEQQDLVGIVTLNGTLFFPKGGSGGMDVPWERKRPGDEERVLAARQSLPLPGDKVEATLVYEDTHPQPHIGLPRPVPTVGAEHPTPAHKERAPCNDAPTWEGRGCGRQ